VWAAEAELLIEAENWREAGRRVAVATVVETWGSAARPGCFAWRVTRSSSLESMN
jgi:xanthine/CO dehydrogenase XdhC/CoxF family maturation factor